MEQKEVIHILTIIESVYPQFKINDEMVLMWLKLLKEMDFNLVMERLTAHMTKHPFPPVISEIAAFQKTENVFLQRVKQWEKEGRERIERDQRLARSKPKPDWLSESNEHE